MGKDTFMYEFLTQLIVILGRLRDGLRVQRVYRPDRLCAYNWKQRLQECQMDDRFIGQGGDIACCDCGLQHFIWAEEQFHYGLPVRPKDYNYRLRFFAVKSSKASEEMKKAIKAWRS